MESVVRNVRDIEAGDRRALEHVVGQRLRNNQRLIIQLAEIDVSADNAPAEFAPPPSSQAGSLPDWCKVYDGLSEEEIAEVERIALRPISFGGSTS